MAMKVMLDSNIADRLDADADTHALVKRLVDAGRLSVMVTAVQREEVGRTPAARRGAEKLAALDCAESVDEVGFYLDFSHLDQTTFGSDEEHAIVDAVRGTDPDRWVKRTNDGIIAATATRHGAIVVTENQKDFARAQGLRLWSFDEFRAWAVAEAASL